MPANFPLLQQQPRSLIDPDKLTASYSSFVTDQVPTLPAQTRFSFPRQRYSDLLPSQQNSCGPMLRFSCDNIIGRTIDTKQYLVKRRR
jgi:hypothetical protein